MSSGKDPKEAITPVKSSPVRSVVGDIFTTSYYLIPKNLKVDLLLKPNKSMLAEPDPNTPVCRLIGTKEMCSMSLNKRRRPMLTSRSETALSDMPIFNLIGPLDVTAKQERLVPFVQNKQEMSTDPKEDLPCQRNEKIFVGDNVITIDRIIRLKSLESTKRFSVVEHRDYVSDKTLNTAREKASESIMTAKSYGHSPPYYSLSSLKKRGSRCGRDSAKSPKRRIAEPMDSINDRKASRSRPSVHEKNQRQQSRHLTKVDRNIIAGGNVAAKRSESKQIKQELVSPKSSGHVKPERPECSDSSDRSGSLDDLSTARQYSTTYLTSSDEKVFQNGCASSKHWLNEIQVKTSGKIIQELKAVICSLERSLQSTAHKANATERGRSSSMALPHRNDQTDCLNTVYNRFSSFQTDELLKCGNQISAFSRNSKERRTDTGISSSSVDPKFISQTTGTASNSNSKTKWLTNPAKGSYQKSKASRSQSRRTYREERRQARKFCSIRTDLLEHIPSMFDEQIKTSRSPGCSTERKLRNNSFEAVLSDSLRNYFGSNESEENPSMCFLDCSKKKLVRHYFYTKLSKIKILCCSTLLPSSDKFAFEGMRKYFTILETFRFLKFQTEFRRKNEKTISNGIKIIECQFE
ncbi:unnamed protein product [Toxocara canis]|uniref:Spermatogenesis associated 6 n=1 Tax=Toxocara canis TaxID=6265 RepID=A0A183V3E0_TOXCA|nr:unnamed protein product [Toxocara canis]